RRTSTRVRSSVILRNSNQERLSQKRSWPPALTTRPTKPPGSKTAPSRSPRRSRRTGPRSSAFRRSLPGTGEPSTPRNPSLCQQQDNKALHKALVAALEPEGALYAPASRHDGNFTLAFPIFAPGTFTCCIAVGMVESGVILARTDLPAEKFSVSNPQSGTYAAKVELENPLTKEKIPFTNSWQSIDVTVPGKTFTFLTPHSHALEPSASC